MNLIFIGVGIIAVLSAGAVVYYMNKNKKLKPAKHLKHEHLSSENNMEKYRLSWTQSSSSVANTQDVVATINAGPETVLATGLFMTTSFIEYDFETGADVIWWVVTYNEDKSQNISSETDEFLAENLEPLTPALALSHEWISHS